MQDLLAALGLVLVIEGLLYALAPDGMRRLLAAVMDSPANTIRIVGVATAIVGVLIVWAARG